MTFRTISLIFISLFIFSCSRGLYPEAGTENLVIYPAPPDTARIQFLTKISSSKEVSGTRKSLAQFLFGTDVDATINKPYGVTSSKGKILVCDTYIHGIHIIDMEKNKVEQFIPKGKGELKVPINCFVDSKNYLYVADSERKQIVIFDQDGEYFNSIGSLDNFKPVDVFVDADNIWVTNLTSHQVNVFKNDGKYELVKKFPEVDSSQPESLFSPTNLFVTADKVYVTDFGDFKVKVYNHDGEFISSVGTYGQGVGQLARPKGIAVDRNSNLYVIDAGFENCQIFNNEGKLLMFFGGTYKGPGDMWLPAKVALDYENLKYFEKYVDPEFKLKYLIYVTNQFGPDKLNIYGAVEPLGAGEKPAKKSNKKKRKKQGPKF